MRYCGAVFTDLVLSDPPVLADNTHSHANQAGGQEEQKQGGTGHAGDGAELELKEKGDAQVPRGITASPPSQAPFKTDLVPQRVAAAIEALSDTAVPIETKRDLRLCAQLCAAFTEIPWSTEYALYCANHHRALDSLSYHAVRELE